MNAKDVEGRGPNLIRPNKPGRDTEKSRNPVGITGIRI